MSPLTIELVPRTCWFSNVRSEVSASQWEAIKKHTFLKAMYVCEVCGGEGPRHPVECHEVWHYDDEAHVQTLVRFQALCPKCHQVKHFGLATANGRYAQAVRHLRKVNGWSEDDVKYYLEAVYEQWMRRSSHEWTLDLSYLEQWRQTAERKELFQSGF
jgi:hypothetical protein